MLEEHNMYCENESCKGECLSNPDMSESSLSGGLCYGKIMNICTCGENKDVCADCLQETLKWAATKLVEFRQRFGNAGFSTADLDKLMNILGTEKFIAASEPARESGGVWEK